MLPPLLLLVALANASPPAVSPVAARIDQLTEKHWQARKVKPAPMVDDATFLRRVTLDLAGRVPTHAEAVAFARDAALDRRQRAMRRLMDSPEYAFFLGRVLDDIIQGPLASDAEFLEYLRAAVAEHRPWDRMFREIMLGPWDTKEGKRADRFLARRQNNLDDLTNDTSRVFLGVNVSCAKCHDHPLVLDWTQEHYYGMASFFNPTYEAGKGKRSGAVSEKAAAEVMFVTTKGERRTARVMFLSGQVVEQTAAKSGPASKQRPAAAPGRRELLVKAALENRVFFRRNIANRLWAHFLGRGLVSPVDQMHSANPPAVPGLLEWLGDELASNGYDLDRLVLGIVSSGVYQRASRRPDGEESSGESDFAQMLLKPLTPQQYALAIVIATGDGSLDEARTPQARGKKYRELENQAAALLKPGLIDARGEKFQSSTGEALYMSNHPDVQRLVQPSGKNLVARLAAMKDTSQVVDTAVWTVLGRAPAAEERADLARWLEGQKGDRARACSQLVWALVTSAEFRFNH